MYCKNCGNEIIDGSTFCSKCGSAISNNMSTTKSNQKSKIIKGFIIGFISGFLSCGAILPNTTNVVVLIFPSIILGFLGAIVGANMGKQ